MFLWANQDDLTPTIVFYSGFISDLQRLFWHIGNLWNCNGFGDLTFTIGFALRIIWTLVWYDHMIWLEHMCSIFIMKVVYIENLYQDYPLREIPIFIMKAGNEPIRQFEHFLPFMRPRAATKVLSAIIAFLLHSLQLQRRGACSLIYLVNIFFFIFSCILLSSF